MFCKHDTSVLNDFLSVFSEVLELKTSSDRVDIPTFSQRATERDCPGTFVQGTFSHIAYTIGDSYEVFHEQSGCLS